MNQLVTIRSFNSSIDFELAKAYLESAGIECYVKDEIINRSYVANVNGGVKLQVSEEHLEEAIQLLTEGGYIKQEDYEPTTEFKWAEKIVRFFSKKNKTDQ